jgi:hypothetical protein
MNEESIPSPSRDEARVALAEVSKVIDQTRLALAHGPAAPILILWGAIWVIADCTTQFYPVAMQWLWVPLDVIGIGGSWWFSARHRFKVKRPGHWRFGAAWGILFFYAYLWIFMLKQTPWPRTNEQWVAFEPTYRGLTAYAHTIPMFAYVIMGLWFGRFFIILGALVTALIVLGLCFIPNYFYLWLAITGGGSLIISGVFIRKFWKSTIPSTN